MTRSQRRWLKHEDDFLTRNVKRYTNEELAERCDRTPTAIKYRIKHLKLTRNEYPKMCRKCGTIATCQADLEEHFVKRGGSQHKYLNLCKECKKADEAPKPKPVKKPKPVSPIKKVVAELEEVYKGWGMTQEEVQLARVCKIFEEEIRYIDKHGTLKNANVDDLFVIRGDQNKCLLKGGVLRWSSGSYRSVNMELFEEQLLKPCNYGAVAPHNDLGELVLPTL